MEASNRKQALMRIIIKWRFIMYALIQYPEVNSRFMQVIKLEHGAKLSPAGYVIGSYKVVFPKLTISSARKIMQVLTK